MNVTARLAQELGIRTQQATSAVALLDEGSTVPFIARYRKEVTGGLDDTQLRNLEERLGYLRELEARRESIRLSLSEQGVLDDALASAVTSAATKTELEDLYLPYRPKRRTKAQAAREAGLAPLAEALIVNPDQPEQQAAAFVNPDQGVADSAAALEGARQILMERFAEHPGSTGDLRETLWSRGVLAARLIPGQEEAGAKFSDYFDFAEAIHKIPSHRALALFRGRQEGVLDLRLALADDLLPSPETRLAAPFRLPNHPWLSETVRKAWRFKLQPRLETELLQRLREAAEAEAIRVFAHNLKDLLLAAPAGPRATMGLDPGLRTGIKVAVVDATGKLVDTATCYPHQPRNQWRETLITLAGLIRKHRVELIAIGNGTASRETDKLAGELVKAHDGWPLHKIMVSEAGASVYSASALAAAEFPDLDVSLRGAVSIARRLQDPLAELVKIEPKAIGVGQYQHDINQNQLARSLDAVVEDCVNAVGVDVNTASSPLLARVAGLSTSHAQNIVAFRDEYGAFHNRKQFLKVPRLGAKTFEQAAGFLRIMDGDNPLDRSAVHPESYKVVQRMAGSLGRDMGALIGNHELLKSLNPARFTDERVGLPTVQDILAELDKPGRDPRPAFQTATFKDGVENMADLTPGMMLEGVVSNVANFGAFVDIGVHQDGLVHVSQLADRFVKDPREVVKAGDVVRVKVVEVDLKRRRIALTMRSDDASTETSPRQREASPAPRNKGRDTPKPGKAQQQPSAPAQANNALADAFAKARRSR